MNLSLSIPYNQYFSGLVNSFVAEIAQIYGADAKEKMQLTLASEEIFGYILRGFPKEEEELFHLTCVLKNDELSFIFSNKGIPLNARKTADYSLKNVSLNDLNNLAQTMDSLGLALAKEMTDSMDFFNQGDNGWQIVIQKRLQKFLPPKLEIDLEDKESLDKRFKVIVAGEKEIPQLINLVYDTYRYSYAKKIFYDEKELAKALQTEKIIILAAENKQNQLIGSIGLFFDTKELAEIGATMVDPRYRDSLGLLLLMKQCKKFVLQSKFKHTVFYVKLVTTHVMSQRLILSTARFTTLGFRLSVHKNAKFIGIAAGNEHRESLLDAAFITEKKDQELILYLPKRHKEIIKAGLDSFFNWQEGRKAFVSSGLTEMDFSWQLKDRFLEIEVKKIGSDFKELLKEKTFTMQQDEVITCLLHLPLNTPWPADLEDVLDQAHYFFSGICLNSEGQPEVVYTNLFHQKFDFNLVKVHDPLAEHLLHYIAQEYLKVRR